ncbi:cytochrome b [Halobacterium bonnevillei]|uniref:Cytochrome bc complex cytochrome b subunit n=1 Tax=Halobacterium bonnevillei TaxID=2692200 RepID=A0A6B0SIG9_9EURY|nr:cytochrome bc complex cytochrome b subunit [Halobacterium bonnevillei]MXR19641.1 cytochrome bc complex cytochrome b subunit [Halobacterium bonnevillei]
MSRLDRAYEAFDDRLGLSGAQQFLGKAFPAEDSFLLGEVALFCFVVLVLTGTFLGFFFEPSTTEVAYEGSVAEFQGVEMPAAYVSVLNITYDVPFGMLIRRLHHWAAHLFVASLGLHMLRVFFTGAYRNPRELNWLVGTALAGTSMFAAYTGYALPFDEFASTAAGIGYNVAVSIPIVGDLLGQVVFGGEFPASATIPRFFFLHVYVLPLLIAALIGVHMVILLRQKHTEAERDEDVKGRPAARADGSDTATGATTGSDAIDAVDREDDSVVVGLPAVPNQVAVSAVVFFLTLATLSLLAGLLPVHNVAEYGPNDPASTPSLVMPDWFLMWGYGFLKLTPSWMSFDLLGVHFSSEFVGGLVLPGLVFVAVAVWPFVDYEQEPVHFTANPFERPRQTAVGVAAVVFVMVASIAGMDVIVADLLGSDTAAIRPYLTAALFVVPVAAGLLTYSVLRDSADASDSGHGGDNVTDERSDGTEDAGGGGS